MAEQHYDVHVGIRSSKSDEKMLGFSVFSRSASPQRAALLGMVKIAAFQRSDGSGYLTLTFLIDRDDSTALPASGRWIGPLDEAYLRARLGPRFEMAMDLMLPQDATSPVFIEEIDLYFRPLAADTLALVAEELFPVLSDSLELSFEPLESWADPLGEIVPAPAKSQPSWVGRLRAWMGLN
ncbi:MAG: hypothetical protein ACOYLM_00115 [Methylococcaceae bacterium]